MISVEKTEFPNLFSKMPFLCDGEEEEIQGEINLERLNA